ncbi:hypothetical protein ZWY2020_029338 [Hordeum vulgare]|nr:hypothetical protein ZWY2020_029338 [Hordeum vulgare]
MLVQVRALPKRRSTHITNYHSNERELYEHDETSMTEIPVCPWERFSSYKTFGGSASPSGLERGQTSTTPVGLQPKAWEPAGRQHHPKEVWELKPCDFRPIHPHQELHRYGYCRHSGNGGTQTCLHAAQGWPTSLTKTNRLVQPPSPLNDYYLSIYLLLLFCILQNATAWWRSDAGHPMVILIDTSSTPQDPSGPMTRAPTRAIATKVTSLLSAFPFDTLETWMLTEAETLCMLRYHENYAQNEGQATMKVDANTDKGKAQRKALRPPSDRPSNPGPGFPVPLV